MSPAPVQKRSIACRDREVRLCKAAGPWLLLPGGECRYPAAELCPKRCGACQEIEAAFRCQTSLNAGTPLALRTNNVDWESFFEGMLSRFEGRLLSRKTPWLAEFPSFLSEKEADLLVAAAERTGFEEEEMPKETRDVWKIDCESLQCQTDPFVNEVYRRVGELLQIPQSFYESLEFLRYGKGQHYTPHMDSSSFGQDDEGESVRSGLRILTVFFYLSGVEAGGETGFPNARPKELKVTPTKGKVVVWANTESNMFQTNEHALHTAIPVRKGIKYAANFWVHPANYRVAESYSGPACKRQ
eukprot:TRINITY_DN44989_c0_g1_i1.p1 TRINITY_DN44989_c0_g1~~TRINITY_DN44989_c0_g1_i1.p1  ORF type:complete len:333 (+),score=56.62 TRINITY_DN44989_c0_g1_i1:100-999(+)